MLKNDCTSEKHEAAKASLPLFLYRCDLRGVTTGETPDERFVHANCTDCGSTLIKVVPAGEL